MVSSNAASQLQHLKYEGNPAEHNLPDHALDAQKHPAIAGQEFCLPQEKLQPLWDMRIPAIGECAAASKGQS